MSHKYEREVEVGERQAAIDLEPVVDHGVSIADVARDVRENVIAAWSGSPAWRSPR